MSKRARVNVLEQIILDLLDRLEFAYEKPLKFLSEMAFCQDS